MNPTIAGILITVPSIFVLFFGLWVFLKNPGSRINRSYFGIVISFLIWSVANFMLYVIPHEPEALNFWLNMAFVGPAVFLPFFVYFSYVFPENDRKISWSKFALIALPIFVLVPLCFAEQISLSFIELQGEIGWGWGFYFYYFVTFCYLSWAVLNFIYKLRHEKGVSNRRAILYIFAGLFLGFNSAAVFNFAIPVFWENNNFIFLGPTFAGFFISAFTSYAIIRYDLMEIKVIAKQALFYGVVVALTTALLSVVVLVSRFLEDDYPMLSLWLIPAVFSLLAVFLGLYIWHGMQASEALKYEFITVVTHKFRTPLTRVMWAVDDLKIPDLPQDQRLERAKSAENAAQNILELVNLLTTVSGEKNALQNLNKEIDISAILKKLLEEHRRVAAEKNIVTEENVEDGIIVFADKSRARFVMSVMLENAVMYTKQGGKINVALISDGDKAHFQVKDTGIGMDKKTQNLVFSTFFRGEKARLEDTEGMGVGLYIAKRIVDEMDGKISFHSEGDGEGSTFFFEMPIYKKTIGEDQD